MRVAPNRYGWAAGTDQELIAAKHVQGQETVRVVVPMKEPPLLLAVHRVIRRVEVQDDFLWRGLVRLDELINHPLGYLPGRLPIGPVLPPR